MADRATRSMFTNYKPALKLFHIYHTESLTTEWLRPNYNQVLTSKQAPFHINKDDTLTMGMNAMTNKLHNPNDKIPIKLLNTTYSQFRIECKSKFLRL